MLLHNAITARRQSILELQSLGEMRKEIDVEFFARQWGVSSWSTILLWTHGQIPLAEFEEHYIRAELHALLPGLTAKQAQKYGQGITKGRLSRSTGNG
jgi:hypothetical protein